MISLSPKSHARLLHLRLLKLLAITILLLLLFLFGLMTVDRSLQASSIGGTAALSMPIAAVLTAPDPAACQQRRAALAATFAANPSVQPPLLEVRDIEVTQAITRSDKQYITDRSTAVVVHLTPTVNLSQPISITTCLHIYANQTYSKTLTAPVEVRLEPTSTMVTVVFEPLLFGYAPNVALYFELIDSRFPLTTTYAIDSRFSLDFVLDSVEPQFLYVPVDFIATPEPAVIAHPNGDAMMQAILPVSDQEPIWRYQAATAQTVHIGDIDGDQTLLCGTLNDQGAPTSEEEIKLIQELNDIRQNQVTVYSQTWAIGTILTKSIGSMDYVHLYGWVAAPNNQKPLSCNALTVPAARLSFGTTTLTSGQRTYGHEFFHIIRYLVLGDIGHADKDRNIAVAGWDVNNHLPSTWQVVGVQQRKASATSYVIMTTADQHLTNETWIGEADYNVAIAYVCAANLLALVKDFPECSPEVTTDTSACLSRQNAAIHGFMSGDGRRVLALRGVSLNPWYSQPTYTYTYLAERPMPFTMIFSRRGEPPPTETVVVTETTPVERAAYMVQQAQEAPVEWQQIAAIPFDATVISEQSDVEDEADNVYYGFFNVVVPPAIFEQSDRIEIRNIDGEILPFLTRSENIPSIPILEPRASTESDGGAVVLLQEQTVLTNPVTTTLDDQIAIQTADADRGELTCHFVYSPDAGASWIPLQIRPASEADRNETSIRQPCPPDDIQTYTITNRSQLPASEGRGVLRAFVSDGYNVYYRDIENVVVDAPAGSE
jgi:hypothetical protein